uniref:Hippocampus abundant transcript-like protein 1 isoform X2 n=1 Tax=Elaeis guineensis var. tenera TaxID=51953 RepID=A0A8N4F5N8_ELAGV|nr:hippocampus abundant transcript-like protein 1 isoform X2 [Elaeis guineensis]
MNRDTSWIIYWLHVVRLDRRKILNSAGTGQGHVIYTSDYLHQSQSHWFTVLDFEREFESHRYVTLRLSLAQADKVGERRRAAAFGVFSGVSCAGFVSGTVAARFLSTSSTFQVSATVAVIAAAYMRLFLVETDRGAAGGGEEEEEASLPLCSSSSSDSGSSPKLPALRKFPSLEDMIGLLRSSLTLSRAAVVVFFNSFAESGVQCALLYFLKAQFQFSKDQFADLLLIGGIAGAFSQLVLMHLLIPTLDEEKLLNIGLLASCAHIFLYSIAWSYWVPYLAAIFILLSVFIQPCIRSIISKKVGPSEQGMAQGCITGIGSFATIMSPLLFTPLTAWFLSEDAPFKFKGFSIMCAGFASLIAFMLSIMMRAAPPTTSQKLVNAVYVQA